MGHLLSMRMSIVLWAISIALVLSGARRIRFLLDRVVDINANGRTAKCLLYASEQGYEQAVQGFGVIGHDYEKKEIHERVFLIWKKIKVLARRPVEFFLVLESTSTPSILWWGSVATPKLLSDWG
jgi:hypothetical protein